MLNGEGEAEVIISLDRRSKEAMEKYWYVNVYQYYKERLPGWEESTNQKGEKLQVAGERVFLVRDDRVSRMLRCDVRICRSIVAYSDNLELYIVFDEKLRRNWLDLTEQVVQEVAYFEQSGRALGR